MCNCERVLVTGGAGFIGSHIVEKLLKTGHEVTIIDNLSTGGLNNIHDCFSNENVRFVTGDIRDPETVRKCAGEVDGVIHLAAIVSVPFSIENPTLTYETNAAGTLNLLDSCLDGGAEKFVFASSCSLYGEAEHLPIGESHSTRPVSPYATSKLEAERHCIDFYEESGLDTTILRLFNVYGPRQTFNQYSGVIAKFVRRANQSLPLIVHGDGTQTRDFVHVYDVADAFLRALEDPKAEGHAFNIGSGTPTSINELAETVLHTAGKDLQILHEKSRDGDLKHSYADVSKAQNLLGYNPKVRLAEGLRTLFELSATVGNET